MRSPFSLFWICFLVALGTPEAARGQAFTFIDTSFANASPLNWEVQEDQSVRVDLMYDYERGAANRAAGHWHFRVEGKPGSTITLVLNRFQNVWNGKSGLPISEATITFTSTDGENWDSMETEFLEDQGQLRFDITLPDSGGLYVARLPPYRISDLQRLLDDVSQHALVDVQTIGKTVQGRPLEIVRVGNPDAPFRVFLRGRAHPWEPGGSWVIDGMIRHLLATADDPESTYLKRFCLYVLPMANKDGVANGRTRFNMLGKDLNRDWQAPPDEKLCPENAALESWLTRQLANGKRPHLAFEMHNDESGRLHLNRLAEPQFEDYMHRMRRLEELLRKHTWFREGSKPSSTTLATTLGQGWQSRFGIDAMVHELNANWIEGLQQHPSAENWQRYGRQLCDVFAAYFE